MLSSGTELAVYRMEVSFLSCGVTFQPNCQLLKLPIVSFNLVFSVSDSVKKAATLNTFITTILVSTQKS